MRTILPLLTVSFGLAAVACSSSEGSPALTPESTKGTVSTTHQVKASVVPVSNEFACAAEVNAAKTQVSVPTALFDKASSSIKVGTTILIRGFQGNTSNTTGLAFKVSGIAPGTGGKTVLSGAQVEDSDAFDSLEYNVSTPIGAGATDAAECVAGSYKGTGSATDPAVSNGGSSSNEIPVASGGNGIHYEFPPQELLNVPFSVDATGGGKVSGTVVARLDAAYFDLAGKFDVKGGLLPPKVRADLAAVLDAKVLASLKVTLDSTSVKPKAGVPIKFETDLGSPEPRKVKVPWGYVEYRQSLVVRCNATSGDKVEIKAGAEAKGSAGVFAEMSLNGFDYTGKDGAAWKPQISAKPVFSETSPGAFKGTCEGEVRIKFKILGRDRSYVGAKVFVTVDDKSTCPISGGVEALVHLDPPVLATKEFSAKASYLPDGGTCSGKASISVQDACDGKGDGWFCDTTKDTSGNFNAPDHAYQCAAGKLVPDADRFCGDSTPNDVSDDGGTCKSVSSTGVMSCL